MYYPDSLACSEPNSQTPMSPERIANQDAYMAAFAQHFVDGNNAFNEILTALGGNPIDADFGNAGIPTNGTFNDPAPYFPMHGITPGQSFTVGGGSSDGGAGSSSGGASCVPPEVVPLVTVFQIPHVVVPPAAPPRVVAPPAAIAPAASQGPPVCEQRHYDATGLLPARDWLECRTPDGGNWCGWNDYMESINWDRPFASPAAAAAAAAKYASCMKNGAAAAAKGVSGVGPVQDFTGAVIFGFVGLAAVMFGDQILAALKGRR